MATVVPVAKGITLCDYHVGYSDGKVDLYGLFNAIRPESGYPYTQAGSAFSPNSLTGLGMCRSTSTSARPRPMNLYGRPAFDNFGFPIGRPSSKWRR
jgi:hypothetical protein